MVKTKIIYESYSGGNIIIKTNDGYLLVNRKGATAIFDGQNTCKAVIKNIESYGNLQYHKGNRNGFYWADTQGRPIFNLAKLIWAVHRKTSVDKIKNKKVMFKNGNTLDLRIENLFVSEIEVSKYKNYIIIFDRQHQKIAIADYSDELFEIMESMPIYYEEHLNIFRTVVHNKFVDISYICWAFYKCKANKYTINDIVYKMKQEFIDVSPDDRSKQLVIDHKDSNHFNNLECNLQIITHGQNCKKSNLTTKLKPNQFYVPLKTDNENGTGEVAGKFVIKFDLLGALYFLITKNIAFDVELLPAETDADCRVDNLSNMIKKDTMPENKIKLATSNLQYGALIFKGLLNLAEMCKETQNKNITKQRSLR